MGLGYLGHYRSGTSVCRCILYNDRSRLCRRQNRSRLERTASEEMAVYFLEKAGLHGGSVSVTRHLVI